MSPTDIPTVSGVYRITCQANSRIYIGSAVNLRKRRNAHFRDLRNNRHHSITLQRAFNKYGPNAFIFEVLEFVLLPEMLTAREQYWFDTLRPFGKRGFNLNRVAGSCLGRPAHNRGKQTSPEVCARISASKMGKPSSRRGKKLSPAHCQSMSAVRLGKPAHNRGKKASPEACANNSAAHRDKKLSPETRAKISAAGIDRKPSPETRIKLSAAQLGNTKALGYKHTPEALAKIRAAKASKRKTLIVTAPDGTEYLVCGVKAFSKEHHLDYLALMKIAKGKQRSHKGWTARFPETSTG